MANLFNKYHLLKFTDHATAVAITRRLQLLGMRREYKQVKLDVMSKHNKVAETIVTVSHYDINEAISMYNDMIDLATTTRRQHVRFIDTWTSHVLLLHKVEKDIHANIGIIGG